MEIVCGCVGVGMVDAEDAGAPVQDVLVDFACSFVFTELSQVGGQVVRDSQGLRVIIAEGSLAPGEGVLVQVAGAVVLAQC